MKCVLACLLTLWSLAASATIPRPWELLFPPGGGSNTISFFVPAGVPADQLYIRAHALNWTNKASIALGTNAAFFANNLTFSGIPSESTGTNTIGGGAHTVHLWHDLATNVVKYGATNTITVWFNDNVNYQSSGFRLLDLKLLSVGTATNIIPSAEYVDDNPATWGPPGGASATNGSALFNAGALTWRGTNITSSCVSCHAHRGIDLAYQRISNLALMIRSVAHGLTTNQGNDIAAYIRTTTTNFINVPTNTYAWTPPYQPGPGLDAKNVNMWSAGGGIDNVYTNDLLTLQDLLAPGYVSANEDLNAREQRVFIQLPDWNHWLPMVNPGEFWGATWSNSPAFLKIGEMEARATNILTLKTCIAEGFTAIIDLVQNDVGYPTNNPWPLSFQLPYDAAYALWMTKMWSVMHEFDLETNGVVAFGSRANERGWPTQAFPFRRAPHIAGYPQTGHIYNDGSPRTWDYLSAAWYQVQLILFDGAHQQTGNNPIDWPYQLLFAGAVCNPSTGCAGLMYLQLVKAMQQYGSDNRAGPWLYNNGWQPVNFASPWFLMSDLADDTRPHVWKQVSNLLRKDACQQYLTEWDRVNRRFIPSMYWTNSPTNFNGTFATPTETVPIPNDNAEGGRWNQRYWWLPEAIGSHGLQVNPALVLSIIQEGQAIWPGETNWPSLLTNVAALSSSATAVTGKGGKITFR